MADGGECPHIVINNNTIAVHSRTDAVVEHQRDILVKKFQEMVVPLSVLGLRDNHATDTAMLERLTDAHLALVLLATLCHDNGIAPNVGLLLDARQNAGEIEMVDLRNDDPDECTGTRLAPTE